ncbi:ABC transporter ATP-binding protein [Geminicoccus roseus]|uniref:ABC transporter ATP-binding protein n=1 Tax=Geminicoccus roseus TaxID=404900 RepID=UPI0003F83DAD|nr:ABC transporter ATP-binding protein [Geminicoccus roseus]
MSEAIRFENVVRSFGPLRALDGVSFSVADGEFFSMLGPSGSGKTTCLRLVAGFDRPTSGVIRIAGRPAAGTPPWERDVNTVFQDYALFPHMSVRDNVAYGLMIRGQDRATRSRRADAMLASVALEGFGERRTAELSGGQRQRVALARALVLEPRVLLLDEPLGALDLKLRQQMQGELRALQRRVGITFVYVTHDQGEALAMSDRIAVFNHGRIEQVGTPREVYDRPATSFVADFVGAANVLPGALLGLGRPVAIRPERLRLDGGERRLEAVVVARHFLGAGTRIEARLADGSPIAALVAETDPARLPPEGAPVVLGADAASFLELER